MKLLVPALDICFWHNTPQLCRCHFLHIIPTVNALKICLVLSEWYFLWREKTKIYFYRCPVILNTVFYWTVLYWETVAWCNWLFLRTILPHVKSTPKRKCHFNIIILTVCTGSFNFDNFRWSQWQNIVEMITFSSQCLYIIFHDGM